MAKYKVEGVELDFFTIKTFYRVFNWTASAVRMKEFRGSIPKARFRNPAGQRIYLPEEIAVMEYIFREVWTLSRGHKTPDWVKNLSREAVYTVQEICLKKGKVESEEELMELGNKYKQFSPFKAILYIKHWRSILLQEQEEDEDILNWVDDY